MAKRFVDSNKYKKRFIRNLPSAYKIFWDYIICNCDNAGIWHVDFDVARVETGEKSLNEKKAKELFKEKIISFDNDEKWFIPSFIDFQYGKLKEDAISKPLQSVIKQLKNYNLWEVYLNIYNSVSKGYAKGLDTAVDALIYTHASTVKEQEEEKDKEQNKCKYMDRDKAEDQESRESAIPFSDFWELYDKKRGDKVKLEKKWDALSHDERKKIMEYIPKYIKAEPDKKFRKDPQTFLNNCSWNDELIYNDDKFRRAETIEAGEKMKVDYERLANELVVKRLEELRERKVKYEEEYSPIDEAEYLIRSYQPNVKIVCPSFDLMLERYIRHYLGSGG